MKEKKPSKYATYSFDKITAPEGKPKAQPKASKIESGKDMRCRGK